METKAISKSMKHGPNSEFGFGIFTTDRRHSPASLLGAQRVHED
jgi:hypothetical protein